MPESNPPPPVDIRVDLNRRINYAMQQNDVPVVRSVTIDNRSPEPLRDLRLTLSAEPSFAAEWISRPRMTEWGEVLLQVVGGGDRFVMYYPGFPI